MFCVTPLLHVQAHGAVLQGWAAAELRLAAGRAGRIRTVNGAAETQGGLANDSAAATLRRVDTFLAANWQMYEEFAAEVLHKVSFCFLWSQQQHPGAGR